MFEIVFLTNGAETKKVYHGGMIGMIKLKIAGANMSINGQILTLSKAIILKEFKSGRIFKNIHVWVEYFLITHNINKT